MRTLQSEERLSTNHVRTRPLATADDDGLDLQAIAPRYEAWSNEYRQAIFAKCDVDAARPIAQAYRVVSVVCAWPTFLAPQT